jgi:Bacterial transcriptional activator domain
MATIASLLRERVSLQVNSVDRIFLAGCVPKLQSEGMVVRFLLDRGFPIPSPAGLGKISQSYVRAIEERVDLELALGRGQGLIPVLVALTAKHPLRERLRGQLMLRCTGPAGRPRRWRSTRSSGAFCRRS